MKEPVPPVMQKLLERIDHLCARCNLLSRKVKQLQQENERLTKRAGEAKKRLSHLVANISEYDR